MKKVDIKIGYICNNNCYFCIQGEEKRNKYKPKKIEEIKKILQDEFDNGARAVTFTGGEPTLHKTLIDGLKYATKIGYKHRQIQSNGQTFSDINFCIKLIKAGANAFEPSIHGATPQIHDYLVQTPGAWKKVVQGIRNLKKLGQPVLINSVITKQNYKKSPLLAKLLTSLKVDYFQFAFPHIGGDAMKYRKEIVPTKTEIMPYIKEGLDIARKGGIRVHTEAIPFCLMQGYEWAVGEQYLGEATVFDAEYEIDSFTDYRLNVGKVKSKNCIRCKMFSKCEGPWIEYYDLFGWNEFEPII